MDLTLAAVFGGLLLIGALECRQAVVAALTLAIFEGAIRKWVFPEYHQWVYFAKDFLLLGAYLGFFGPRLVRKKRLFDQHPAISY